jgi:hypothetical protein
MNDDSPVDRAADGECFVGGPPPSDTGAIEEIDQKKFAPKVSSGAEGTRRQRGANSRLGGQANSLRSKSYEKWIARPNGRIMMGFAPPPQPASKSCRRRAAGSAGGELPAAHGHFTDAVPDLPTERQSLGGFPEFKSPCANLVFVLLTTKEQLR